jgi:hypothetical protein
MFGTRSFLCPFICRSGSIWDRSCVDQVDLRPIWARSGADWVDLGPIWARSGVDWVDLGPIWARSGQRAKLFLIHPWYENPYLGVLAKTRGYTPSCFCAAALRLRLAVRDVPDQRIRFRALFCVHCVRSHYFFDKQILFSSSKLAQSFLVRYFDTLLHVRARSPYSVSRCSGVGTEILRVIPDARNRTRLDALDYCHCKSAKNHLMFDT